MKVAVAVIVNNHHQVLITKRPLHTSHGGQWEFPGGKIEADETPIAALYREVAEEVGLQINGAEFLTHVDHHYGLKKVTLFVYWVHDYEGTAVCCESQSDLRWVEIKDLGDYKFPEANKAIIQQLHEIPLT